MLDWSKCPELEADPETQAGHWCFRGTRLSAHIVMEFMSRGYTIDDAIDTYAVNPDQLKAVLRFIATNLEESRIDVLPEEGGTKRNPDTIQAEIEQDWSEL